MAIEIHSNRPELLAWLAPLNHLATAQAVNAERSVSKAFGGSCQIPLAAFATVNKGNMHLRAMVATPDGTRIAQADVNGEATDFISLGTQVVQALSAQDAESILSVCKAQILE